MEREFSLKKTEVLPSEFSSFKKLCELIDKYENQIDWFSHVGIESIELQNVCKKLRASIIDYVIVIVVHNEDSHLNTFLFASEDLKEFFGVYTEVD